jgi:hypothetical protein
MAHLFLNVGDASHDSNPNRRSMIPVDFSGGVSVDKYDF